MTSPFAQPSSFARRSALLACVIGLTAPYPALGGPETPIELRWDAPQGCPQESDVRNRIQKIVGPGRQNTRLRADARITRIDKRFRLELEVRVRDMTGTRSIESSSCDDLAGAAAIEIGLLIHSAEAARTSGGTASGSPADASATSGTGTSGTTTSGTGTSGSGTSGSGTSGTTTGGTATSGMASSERDSTDPKPEPQAERAADETKPARADEPPRPRRVLLQVPLLARSVGPMPATSEGLGLAVALVHESWHVQLEGIAWRQQRVAASGFPGYAADVDRMGAGLGLCREYRFGWVGFSPCLTAGADLVSATGTGRNVTSSTRHAIAITVGGALQTRLHVASWLRLVGTVGGQLGVRRPELTITGLGTIYGFAPGALTATLGIEWAL